MLEQLDVHTLSDHLTIPALLPPTTSHSPSNDDSDDAHSIPEPPPPGTDDPSSDDHSDDDHWMKNDGTTLLPIDLSPILLPTHDPHIRTEDKHTHQLDPLIIRKMHPARIMLKDQLHGDTGANCDATNDASILWYYKLLK
jgi:hypothetical protein